MRGSMWDVTDCGMLEKVHSLDDYSTVLGFARLRVSSTKHTCCMCNPCPINLPTADSCCPHSRLRLGWGGLHACEWHVLKSEKRALMSAARPPARLRFFQLDCLASRVGFLDTVIVRCYIHRSNSVTSKLSTVPAFFFESKSSFSSGFYCIYMRPSQSGKTCDLFLAAGGNNCLEFLSLKDR